MFLSSTKYDDKLKEIQHYKLFEEMLPFVGEDYENSRIMIIGESHFVSEKFDYSIIDTIDYYNKKELIETQLNWINIRKVISKEKLHRFYIELNNLVGLKNIVVFNYFLRPARNKSTFKPKDFDIIESNKVLLKNIEILQPKKILFVSNLAFKESKLIKWDKEINKWKLNDLEFDALNYTAHPNSSWWNKVSNKRYQGKTGKERAKNILNI